MHATAGAGKCAEIVPPLEHRAAKYAVPIAAEATNNQMIRATAKAPSPPPWRGNRRRCSEYPEGRQGEPTPSLGEENEALR